MMKRVKMTVFFALFVLLSLIMVTPTLAVINAHEATHVPSGDSLEVLSLQSFSLPVSHSQNGLAIQDSFIVIPDTFEQELSSIVEFRGLRVFVANKSEPFDDPLDLTLEDPLRLPSLYNESRMRIDAVIQNYLLNSSMAILEFGVNVLQEFPNGTIVTAQSSVQTYRDKKPYDIVVPPGGSFTGSIEFDLILPEFGTYIVQVTAQVVLPDYTLAEIHEIALPFNMTFSLVENPPPNPDILVYNVWFFSLLLVGYLGLGAYGSWAKKRRSK